MKPSSKSRPTVVATATTSTLSSSSSPSPSAAVADCETVSRSYQAQVLGITIFSVVGFVVFIKYVVTKYFAELEQRQQDHQHLEF